MRVGPRHVYLAAAVAAVAAGVIAAARLRWTCDDAYITYRYADNLVRGLGLVFNEGERVEGYTNLSWTLWTALGLRLGASPEAWTAAWGIGCYALALALLAREGRRIADEAGAAWPLPVAAILGAAHAEWATFATGGLETSAFALLALAGYIMTARAGAAAPGQSPRCRPTPCAATGSATAASTSTTSPIRHARRRSARASPPPPPLLYRYR
jgi:hypothetical protein